MVVAQLVERLLPTPEVRSLNPVIGKIWKDENKRNRSWEWPIKNICCFVFYIAQISSKNGFTILTTGSEAHIQCDHIVR